MKINPLFLKQKDMAVLDEFAGRALQDILAGYYSEMDTSARSINESMCDDAYSIAYEMLLARKRLLASIIQK